MENKKNIQGKPKVQPAKKNMRDNPAKKLEKVLADTQALYEASHSLVKMDSSQEILQKAADFVANVLDADRIIVITADTSEQKVLGFYKSGPGQDGVEVAPYSELYKGLTGWVLRELKPALSPKGKLDARESPSVQQRRVDTNCGSVMVAPLLYKDKILGTMTAINRPEQRDFDKEDMNFMMALANQVATAIENNRLYQAIVHEVELRKQTEDELKAVKAQLEQRVIERTIELGKVNTSLQMEINERKIAEAALRESETQYRELFDRATDGIFVADSSGRYVEVNARACSMLGYSYQELLGKRITDLIPAEELNLDPPKIDMLRVGKQLTKERNLICKDGSYLPVEISASLLPDGRLFGMVRDITERKQASDALQKIQANLETAQALARLGSWELDVKTGRGYWSKEMFNLFQCEPSQEVPTLDEFMEKIHPDDRERLLKTQNHAIETGQHMIIEYRTKPLNGVSYHFQATLNPIKDSKGQFLYMAGTVLDITERKQVEEKILNLNAELEQRVEERTSQLLAANQELEAFSYSVSHDLRAPLRAIDGFTRILTEDYEPLLDAEGKRICNVISNEARRMGELIDDLLNFSRLGRAVMQVTSIDMVEMVRGVYKRFHPKDGIQFKIQDLPEVKGDANLLSQVWANLIGNAIKFTSKNESPVIEVGAIHGETENTYYIHDNGAGFDMQYVDKLFGVFQRLHSEVEFEGTGVGLAIVQRIIHKHNGRVWAEGQPGAGATFYFTIPKEHGDV